MLKICTLLIVTFITTASFADAVSAEDVRSAATGSAHWTVSVVNELKTKEFPDKIKNVWIRYIHAMDGATFVLLRYELKENGFHNYFDRLYSTGGDLLVKTSSSSVITPLNSKRAYVRGEDWDLIEKKLIGASRYKYLILKERESPRELKSGEENFQPKETFIEHAIGVVETTDPANVYGSSLRTGYALDADLKVINKIGPVVDITFHNTYVSIKPKKGTEKPYNWDLTPQGSDKVAEFAKYQRDLEIKNQKLSDDFKKDQERKEAEAKALVELKKANEVCFEQAKATRNLAEAYRCGLNLGDKYGNWLLDEPEADVEAIGKAIKVTKMHHSIEYKLKERHKILTGLGHKNMKAYVAAEAASDARIKRNAVEAAAKSTANGGNPADYNQSYKDIQWQQSVQKGGPTWDQIKSNGK